LNAVSNGMDRYVYESSLIPLRGLLERKLGIKSGPVSTQLKKAQRRLPRRFRKDLSFLAEADHMTQNPKLSIMVNESRAQGAIRSVAAYLEDFDPVEARWTRIINFAAKIALYVLVIGIIVIATLYQSDFF